MSTAHEPLVIGPELNGTLMTSEEFDFAEDWNENFRYELINGVLIASPPADVAERGPNEELGRLLRNYQADHPQGHALDYTVTEQMIRTRKQNRRRADRVIWAGLGRIPDTDLDVPQIVVEFVSPGRVSRKRDYVEKRAEYSKIGVREYWIIDRFQREMTVIRFGVRERTILVGGKEVYESSLLPGFKLPLVTLLNESDMLTKARKRKERNGR